MTRANASTRGDKVLLTLGLLTVEVTLFATTASDHGVQRKMFVEVPGEEDHEVGYATFDKVTGQIIPRDQVVKKVATEHGFVYVEDSEIEQLFTLEARTLSVKSVHPNINWRSRKLTSKRYWTIEATPKVVGKKKVPNRAGQISLRALLDTLEAEDAFIFGELVTRGIPKPVVLLHNGELHEVFYSEELREPRLAVELTEADLEKAEAFHPVLSEMLHGVWADEISEPSDVRATLVQQFADEKAKTGDFAKPTEAPLKEASAPDDADALLATLTASMLQKKKAS